MAQTAPESISYRGMRIETVPVNPDRTFDVGLVKADPAVKKIKDAIDLIYKDARGLSRELDRIKAAGDVHIIYNPNYPNRQQDLAKVHVALFLPYYLDDQVDITTKPLPVLISRHGIKWPTNELAAILVHELVGHGAQYLKGLTDTARSNELECDAWLLEEQAYQHFGLDKSSRKMIQFRKQLGGYKTKAGHCTAFLNYVRKTWPDKISLYERLNPDVPALRKLLVKFMTHLEKTGVTAQALAAKSNFIESKLNRLEQSGSPGKIFGTGLYLLEGAGYKQDPERGIRMIKKAAGLNHLKAQYHLATLYQTGKGVKKDTAQAYFWLAVAARNASDDLRPSIEARQHQVAVTLGKNTRKTLDKKAEQWIADQWIKEKSTDSADS
ncbi:MAG: sel1 repeat family protein [Desulfobacterales bacterium]|nr:sel1 repeat family protein [Desulfobacterales bacterium]